MKKLLIFLKNYKLECFLSPAFKMLEACFELLVPLVMVAIIDKGITGQSKQIIYQYGAILVILGVVGLISSLTAQYFAAKAAVGFARTLRETLYSKILGFSYENLDKLGISSLITRMINDVSQVQNGVNMFLRLFLRSPFIVFGAMIMAFTINTSAALIFTIVIPLLFIAVFTITVITIPRYKKIQAYLDRVTGHIKENLSGIRVVRAFWTKESETAEFNDMNEKMYYLSLTTSRISALLNPITLIIVNIALLIVLRRGANLVNTGILTNGEVIALVNYMSQILIELVKLANLIVTINKASASAARLSDTLSIDTSHPVSGSIPITPMMIDSLPEEDPLVCLNHVSFTYPGNTEASLSDINFVAKRGETIGIIGGTGSGKTTLIHLLMRFYDITQGDFHFAGKPVSDYRLSDLRSLFGLVPQKAALFSGTLRQNLTIKVTDVKNDELYAALSTACADDIVKSKGRGLEFEITEGGTNLSGGQKQRLTIARALVGHPKILILDDSSSALDYATDSKLRENLRLAYQSMTVFIVSQRVSSVKDADHILVLEDGHMVGFDTHDNLLKTCNVYSEICESQATMEDTL